MICLGLRLRDLGSENLTWSDLKTIVLHSPRSSAFYRARGGDKALWSDSEYLQAIIADGIRWLVWAKTKDGSKNRNRPKLIPRPGVRMEPSVHELSEAEKAEVDYLLSLPREPNVDGIVPTGS